jgi:hypothetical protein
VVADAHASRLSRRTESRLVVVAAAAGVQDLLIRIFSSLDLPELVHSGAARMSWHLSYSAVRAPPLRALLPRPKPVHRLLLRRPRRHHGGPAQRLHRSAAATWWGPPKGWLVTADELSCAFACTSSTPSLAPRSRCRRLSP